jgi:hypothetical protein
LGGGGSSRCVDVVCSFDVDICLIQLFLNNFGTLSII